MDYKVLIQVLLLQIVFAERCTNTLKGMVTPSKLSTYFGHIANITLGNVLDLYLRKCNYLPVETAETNYMFIQKCALLCEKERECMALRTLEMNTCELCFWNSSSESNVQNNTISRIAVDSFAAIVEKLRPISIVGNPAYAASYHHTYVPEHVNDGNPDSTRMGDNSCYHSNLYHTGDYWWAVDLLSDVYVQVVHVTNRGDCCSERLANFAVYVSSDTYNPLNSTDKQLCARMPGSWPVVLIDVYCEHNPRGRYLSIVLPHDEDTMAICEVMIEGFLYEDLN